jgi:hypothetical protein
MLTLYSKSILPHIQSKRTAMAEWEEVDGSFVGTEVGKEGEGGTVAPPRAAKL